MKVFEKISMSLLASALVLGLASCASTKTEESTKETQKNNVNNTAHVERFAVDWDGAEFGQAVPDWVNVFEKEGAEADGVPTKIKTAAKGKRTFISRGENGNKNLAREQARNGYAFQIAQELNTIARTTYNEVIVESEKTQATIQGTASQAQFTGWERLGETWVQMRLIDHDKNDKITDTYYYYCVYACDKESFSLQAKKYLSNLLGEVVASEYRQKAEAMTDELVKKISAQDNLSNSIWEVSDED